MSESQRSHEQFAQCRTREEIAFDRPASEPTDRGTWLPVAVFLTLVLIFSLTSPAFFTWRNSRRHDRRGRDSADCLARRQLRHPDGQHRSLGRRHRAVGRDRHGGRSEAHPDTDLGLLVLPFGALLGGSLGAFNGAISVFGKIPSFVVTLGTLSVFTGTALSILAGATIMFDLPIFETLSLRQSIPHLPNIALCALLLWLIFIFVGARTRFGRFALLIGGGEQVARTAGIPVDRYKIYAFTVSGVTAGLAGIFAMSRLGAVGPSLGSDLLLNTIAAIVVGGTSLAGGIGGVHRTFIGVAIIVVMNNGLNLLGVGPYWQLVIKGLVVIGAVLISQDRSRG